MKGLDYLRMSFGNVDAKLPPLKEVKPQHLHKCFGKAYAGAAGNHLPALQP